MFPSKKVAEEMQHGSWIRRMFEEGLRLKKELGPENVFDVSLGNPEIEPPQLFQDTLQKILAHPVQGMHRYMPNSGYPETRAAVAALLNKDATLKLKGEDIVMTCGAAGGLNVTLKSLLNAGDEVVILAPYFVEYLYYLGNHQLSCCLAETDDLFQPDLDELDKKIGPKTRALLINYPNNPTGAVYNDSILRKIADLLVTKGARYGAPLLLLLDDAYGQITYDGVRSPCLFNFYPHTIVAASFSKTFSIPGERIGYIAVSPACADHDAIMGALAFCNRTLGFINAPALMQRVMTQAAEALVDVSAYQAKRDYLYEALTSAGYEVNRPGGAFYMFPKTPIPDDVAFIKKLLQLRVLAVPGSGFGRSGFMRISYCVEDRVLEGAVAGLQRAVKIGPLIQ